MRGLHRLVATGAVGGLAAATVAASGAFACTALTSIKVTGAADSKVEAGDQIDIEMKIVTTPTEGGDIEVTWWEPVAGGSRQTATLVQRAPVQEFMNTTRTVTIPAAAVPRAEHYSVVARQFRPNNSTEVMNSASTQLWVTPKATTSTGTELPGVTPATPAVVPATQTQPAAGARARTPSAAPAAGGTAAAPASPAAAPAVTPAVPAADRPGTAPAAVPAAAAEVSTTPAPPLADLWSGLEASKAPSLLDAPATSNPASSTPAGGILLGAGVIAMAGVALVASRRRLALSLTRRR